jgi:hypothetical protein
MTARIPRRPWRSFGDAPLPTPAEALDVAASPLWLLRIECERCGKDRMVNEAHAAPWRDRTLRQILARALATTAVAGLAGKAALLTGIEGVSSRPVRKIVLMG